MSGSDKRKVSTDALETLGMIIDDSQKRDAIHLAVIPVRANQDLRPGWDVGKDGTTDNPIGIVDPFLKEVVECDQWFWLVIYPRQINSLRHVWTHPAFEDETQMSTSSSSNCNKIIGIQKKREREDERKKARKWIEGYAETLSTKDYESHGHPPRTVSFYDLIEGAKDYLEGGYYMSVPVDQTWLDADADDRDFWKNFEIYTGIVVPEEKKSYFFTCSC